MRLYGWRVALSVGLFLALCAPLSAGSAAPGARGTIAFTIGADVWRISADGTQRTRLTREGTGVDPSWSADRRRLLFDGWRDGSLHVLRVKDGHVRTLALALPFGGTTRFAASQPAWARDGRIAFVLSTGGLFLRPAGIFVAKSDGSSVRRVVDRGSKPAWSPDGTRIAFTETVGVYGERDVAIVSADGGMPTRIASGVAPAWSADGRRIAFFDGSTRKLTVVKVDGSEPRVVADGGCLSFSAPAWSPDGRWLAYPACPVDPARSELYVVASTGGTPVRLSRGVYDHGSPDWRPVEPS